MATYFPSNKKQKNIPLLTQNNILKYNRKGGVTCAKVSVKQS